MRDVSQNTVKVCIKRWSWFFQMNDNKLSKPLRLIKYLLELTSIGSRVCKDISDYQRVLWLNKIPHQKWCFTQAWAASEDIDADTWIEIQKYDEPALSEVPEICENWVNHETLYQTKDIPELLQIITINNEVENPDYDENASESPKVISVPKTLHLNDFPKVSEKWDSYVDTHWMPWTELHLEWELVQGVYEKLFLIHQEQQKLGEEYELCIGLGLLSWKKGKTDNIRRHLIIARASIDFEARLGKFTIGPAIDGTQLNVELDMVDAEDQPKQLRITSNESLKAANDNPWDRGTVDPILSVLVKTIHQNGEYHKGSLDESKNIPEGKPVVDFAPALFLRKRPVRGFQEALRKVYNQIEDGIQLPTEFSDICEMYDDDDLKQVQGFENHAQIDSEKIYFPLPFNKEQLQIIHQLNRSNGVLVQGPPGTGKSHTIANLISHLLATGKRVLVTAKTPRALKVLQRKLPEKIQPLTINLLGEGLEERQSLEGSVNGILSEHNNWNSEYSDERIKELEKELKALRAESSEIDNKIMSIREKDIFHHTIIDNKYSGKASIIAKKLHKEDGNYSWLEDRPGVDDALPFTDQELLNIYDDISDLSVNVQEEMELSLPNIDIELPNVSDFNQLVEDERQAKSRFESGKDSLDSNEGKCVLRGTRKDIESLSDLLSKFCATVDTVLKRPLKWIPNAISEVLSDNDTPWKERLNVCQENIEGLKKRATDIDQIHVDIPVNMDRKKLLVGAQQLLAHLNSNGKMGFWFIRPKICRDSKWFLDKVSVDGVNCKDILPLEKLIRILEIEISIEYLWSLWEGVVPQKGGRLFIQVAELEELNEALGEVVGLYHMRDQCIKQIQTIQGLPSPTWHELGEVREYTDICRSVLAKFRFDECQSFLKSHEDGLAEYSRKPNAHPFYKEVIGIISNRLVEHYPQFIDKLKKTKHRFDKLRSSKAVYDSFKSYAPIFSSKITIGSDDDLIRKRIKAFNSAWDWARASRWLEDYLSEDVSAIERRSDQVATAIDDVMEELCSLKAWMHCFDRLTKPHQRHLSGWQQSMRKIGKGKRKLASQYRKDAQYHLSQCREAIPAWIMPLHRVYDTIDPKAEMFDVVIIDEASQCDFESLLLLYLGKKILIVGDDQQISPAHRDKGENVYQLKDDYLYDFDHSDLFDFENSLFDHGKRRFGSPITLREHFRCMPEIIEFSNELCYQSSQLIPLRRRLPGNLEPLKSVYVQNGRREGKASKIVNDLEARQLVDEIVLCCDDEAYNGKTMGVIALQGHAQADLITTMLLEELGAEEMGDRKLHCGDPYSFQGDERDVIFISTVHAPNERTNSITSARDQRSFNVAASRACDQMWLFHSFTRNDLSTMCLRRRLLEFFQEPKSNIEAGLGDKAEIWRELAATSNRQVEKQPKPFGSWFELDVALRIAAKGFRVIPQYPIAEKRIDLVIQSSDGELAVEVDGDHWHGPDQFFKDLERERILRRAGMTFHRIRECAFYSNPEKTMDELWNRLERMGISGRDYNDSQATEVPLEQSNTVEEYADEPLFLKPAKKPKINPALVEIKTVQDAVNMEPKALREIIVQILKERPNNSSKKDAMTGYVLKRLSVLTRGKPRQEFNRKVSHAIGHLKKTKIVTIDHKSKNVRIRLL